MTDPVPADKAANRLVNEPAELAATILNATPLLRTKLARALFCPAAEADRALTEVIKFLTLVAETADGPLTPSARVDLAWHEFILFTRTYSSYCDRQFGKLIHHEPSANHEQNSSQYAVTLQCYRERFGDPPGDFWGGSKLATAFCGNCESKL